MMNTKQAGSLAEVKGEDGANIPTPLSRRPVSGQYRDLSLRVRLTGYFTFQLLITHLKKSTKQRLFC